MSLHESLCMNHADEYMGVYYVQRSAWIVNVPTYSIQNPLGTLAHGMLAREISDDKFISIIMSN